MDYHTLSLVISGDAMTRLNAISKERDTDVEILAECAVEEAALDYYRARNDDPARAK